MTHGLKLEICMRKWKLDTSSSEVFRSYFFKNLNPVLAATAVFALSYLVKIRVMTCLVRVRVMVMVRARVRVRLRVGVRIRVGERFRLVLR